jgi:hypothetical protein
MNTKTNDVKARLRKEPPLNLSASLPGTSGWTTVPGTATQGQSAGRAEFYVRTLRSPKALELEEKLNDASRDGWSLFQIIRQAQDILLVFWRQSRSV